MLLRVNHAGQVWSNDFLGIHPREQLEEVPLVLIVRVGAYAHADASILGRFDILPQRVPNRDVFGIRLQKALHDDVRCPACAIPTAGDCQRGGGSFFTQIADRFTHHRAKCQIKNIPQPTRLSTAHQRNMAAKARPRTPTSSGAVGSEHTLSHPRAWRAPDSRKRGRE